MSISGWLHVSLLREGYLHNPEVTSCPGRKNGRGEEEGGKLKVTGEQH
jgi:hypothetical protein